MGPILLFRSAILVLVAVSGTWGCIKEKSMMVATGPGTITLVDYVYDDKEQEYKPTMSMTMRQAVPQSWANVYIRNATLEKNQKAVCFNSMPYTDPCAPTEGDYYNPFKLFDKTCFKYHREGLYKVGADDKYSGGSGCSFDGTTRVFAVTKIDSQRDAINWTIVEDREVQRCGEPVRRYTRTESIIYKVQRGCILHAKAQDCVPGVETCKPCKHQEVPFNINGVTICINKLQRCNTTRKGFRGCPSGFEVAPDGNKEQGVLLCQPCPPNYNQPNYPDDSGSGYRAKCTFCPEWQESSQWGTQNCRGCPEGHYPRNKKAPLNCTPCPPGSYGPYSGAAKCTKCTGGFYTDKPGQKSCKKCPTEWRCLVPNKILGRFAATPYRWDESGNPACPSLDGKQCWKVDPETCSAKLKKMKELLDAGKIKSVVCGAAHKQLWGFDGYSDATHWCSITKMLFMQPGKNDVGATSCSAKDATMVASPGSEVQTEQASRCDCCDQCSV